MSNIPKGIVSRARLIYLIQESYNKKIVICIGNGWWSIQSDCKDWDQGNTSSVLEALTLALEGAP
jgi:hypothetical protein